MRGILLLTALLVAPAAVAEEPVTIRMMAGPAWGIPPKEATDPRSLARRAVFEEFHRQNPDIRVVNAGGLEIRGERAEAGFLMAMAGDTAPDVFYVNFRQYYNYVDQGFCRPLDDLVERDPEVLARANPVAMEVIRSLDGRIYAIPWFQVAQALYYRKDHFREAGLDPSRPPRTWEEFIFYGRKLVESRPGRAGFSFSAGLGSKAYHWTNFVWQAGGEVVERARGAQMRAAVASPRAAIALDFYRRLVAERWQGPDGRWYGPVAQVSATHRQDIAEGRVSMWFDYSNDILMSLSDVNPSLIGVAQLPAGPAGHANEVNAGMWAINATLRDPRKVEACWRFIRFFASQEAARIQTRRFVELGLGHLVNPALLVEHGFEDIAAAVDPGFVRANVSAFSSGHPEPYGRNMQQVYMILDSALDKAVLQPGRPALEILAETAEEMNRKMLGYTPPDVLARQRAWAYGIAGSFLLTTLGVTIHLGRRRGRRAPAPVDERLPAGANRRRVYRVMALCLLPAAASILVWSYYPLVRGLIIAFQDYRIVQGTRWVGLDNFIAVFTQPIFYRSLANSFLFVGLSIAIGFLIPIFLALALQEVRFARLFWRVVFYLPATMSPIVVAFLWRQFYDRSEQGVLNSLLLGLGSLLDRPLNALGLPGFRGPYDWLGDPQLAMFAVVLPGVWAGAGPGSILYLAALKSIPDERYEAADLDGATWWQKILAITLPSLKPLILINLLGVFIAGFKAMENVFVLTGGGPLYATHTLGLEVWTNAFMLLKFGYATAAAWVMGAILIGFAILQIRSLTRMRFTASRL